MSLMLRSLLIFGVITCTTAELVEGQIVRRALSHIFCKKCQAYDCSCAQLVAAPQPAQCVPPPTQSVGGPIAETCTKTCTTVHPVIETRYRRENYMTYRNECRTAYRQEAYCETVPTTKVDYVTRDEGCYKMIWVPKPVTRPVERTVYKKRTRYRKVPYQYTVQVPEMKSRVIPEQNVRYVKKTRTFTEPMRHVGCAAPMPAPITDPNCAVPTCAAPGYPPTLSGLSSHQSPQMANAVPSAPTGSSWTNAPQQAEVQGASYMPVSTAAHQQPHQPVQQTAAGQQHPHQPVQRTAAGWQNRR